MSNYYYKGTSLNNLFTTPWSSNTTTTMSQLFTNGISTGRSNYNTERYHNSQINYQIHGTDVTNYASPVYTDYTSSTSTRTIIGLDDLSKDELIEKLIKLRRKKKNGQSIPLGYFDLSVPLVSGIEHYEGGGFSKRKGRRPIKNYKHAFLNN